MPELVSKTEGSSSINKPVVIRKRKAPLKPVKMEDIKIEFVDLCVAVPTSAQQQSNLVPTILELDLTEGGGVDEATVLASTEFSPSMDVTLDSSCDDSASLMEVEMKEEGGVKPPRKRRKLDHLSAEEKSQHRKMMNRMSAQSARDRQKALMHQQDLKIKALQQTTESLKQQTLKLVSTNEKLSSENTSLKSENTRLSKIILELEAKLQAAPVQAQFMIQGEVKQEVEGDTSVASDVVFDVVASEDGLSGEVCSNGSSPSKPAVLRTIPLQKGSEEPSHYLSHLNQSEQDQQTLFNKSSNRVALLLLLMSYLGIWTHLKSSESLENSLNKFLTVTSNGSEKNLSKLKTLLTSWLHMKNPYPILKPDLRLVKTEPVSRSTSPLPG